MVVAHTCEYTQNQCIVHFKWVNSLVCEFHLNEEKEKEEECKYSSCS